MTTDEKTTPEKTRPEPETLPGLFIVTYVHRFGHDSWLVRSEGMPTHEQVIATLSDWEGDVREDEWLAIEPAKVWDDFTSQE